MGRKKVVKDGIVSAIYENAIDSLRIGMEFFLQETNYSSRKHAILERQLAYDLGRIDWARIAAARGLGSVLADARAAIAL